MGASEAFRAFVHSLTACRATAQSAEECRHSHNPGAAAATHLQQMRITSDDEDDEIDLDLISAFEDAAVGGVGTPDCRVVANREDAGP